MRLWKAVIKTFLKRQRGTKLLPWGMLLLVEKILRRDLILCDEGTCLPGVVYLCLHGVVHSFDCRRHV